MMMMHENMDKWTMMILDIPGEVVNHTDEF
jgi:hypothetical protein